MLLFYCYETEDLWIETKPCFLKMICGNIRLNDLIDTAKPEINMFVPMPKKKLKNLLDFDTITVINRRGPATNDKIHKHKRKR